MKGILSIFYILFLGQITVLNSQLVYFGAPTPTAQGGALGDENIWVMNLATCEYCPVSNFTLINLIWIHILPNGDLLVQENSGPVTRFSMPSLTPVWTTSPNFYYSSPYTHPNGNIYIAGNNMLQTFNPTNNTFTVVGNLPSGLEIMSLLWYNGSLHGSGGPPAGLYQIPINNPSNTTFVATFSQPLSSLTTMASGATLASWLGGGQWSQTDFGYYDFATGNLNPICPTPLNNVGASVEILPPNIPLPCICLPSSAGLPIGNATFNVCVPNSANTTTQFDAGVIVDYNDGVNYILYTNPNNILGSILAQNNTGIFNFLPSYTAGTSYYVARLVGNITNNVVSLTDPCLDISPPLTLIWRPKPTLISLVGSTDICTGSCEDVLLSIQGTPPFGYGWQWQQNGSPLPGYYNQFFIPSSPITLQACPPPSATGAVQLVLCTISDAFCTNP
jgi:hypothetical protein